MRRNVLHLIPSFNLGGSEQQALQLLRSLHIEGSYGTHVACLEKGGVLLGELESAGFADIEEFRLTSFCDANMLRQLNRCRKFMRIHSIDILQTHDFYTNIFGIYAAALGRVPIRIAAKRETGMRSRSQLFVERQAFGLADAIVANAEGVRKYLVTSGVRNSKIEVIYNAVELAKVDIVDGRKSSISSFGLPESDSLRIVTMVANLRDPVKNHRMFLRAAAKVKETTSGVGFVIAGEGVRMDETKAFAADLGLSDDTFFIGRCSRVAELLSHSTICVLTSWSEGFSNSILEYMAAGRPVIATDVGGASEAIVDGQTGFLVDSDDVEAMAKYLCLLLSEPSRARNMGRKGQEFVREKFSLAGRTQKTLELYDKLLRRKKQV